jgi:hypothetical protein
MKEISDSDWGRTGSFLIQNVRITAGKWKRHKELKEKGVMGTESNKKGQKERKNKEKTNERKIM